MICCIIKSIVDKNFHILSFKYAWEGILSSLKQEPNLKFHLLVGLIVILISFLLKISKTDWIIVIILIGFVVALELTNTAIEAVVNGLTENHHPAAKLAKDISAGAVLVAATTATIIGIIIFTPYILNLWTI